MATLGLLGRHTADASDLKVRGGLQSEVSESSLPSKRSSAVGDY